MIQQLEQRVILNPDINRSQLKSSYAKRLQEKVFDSKMLSSSPWQRGESPRVLFLVPPYTKIIRWMEPIVENVYEHVKEEKWKKFYLELIKDLERESHCLEEMKRAGIPMGLLRLGTAAKKSGYDVKIIDAVFEDFDNEKYCFETCEGDYLLSYGLSWETLAEKIRSFQPHVVGITCSYTHQWGNARQAADLVKSIDEKIVTMMGGVHVTGLPQDALLGSPTDYVVVRQADYSTIELLDAVTLRQGAKKIEDIAGIAFRREGKAVATFPRPYLTDISGIAIPEISLVDLSLYDRPYHSAGKRKTLEGRIMYGFTSIGCNTGCNFCAIPTSQGGFRKMPEELLDEYFTTVTKAGVKEFLVEDDHLFHDPAWARTVFKKLGQYGLNWYEEGGIGLFSLISLLPGVNETFINQSTKNQIVFKHLLQAKSQGLTTERMLQEMSASGCYGGYLAVESANEESLGRAHKPTLNASANHTEEIVRLFKSYNMPVTCGLMLGFVEPKNGSLYIESRERIMRTIEYGKRLKAAGAAFINPFIVTPLPASPNFNYLEKLLGNSMCRNTDLGYSHEFATMDAPDGTWIRDEMNLLRTYALYECNGWDAYKTLKKTGTWPVSND